MLKCASGKSYAHAMYRYMSRIGGHRRRICPLKLCSIVRVFSREKWLQRHAIKLLNSRLPQFSSKDWAKLGRGKLYPPTVMSMTDSTTVEKEVSCLRSSLSLELHFLSSTNRRVQLNTVYGNASSETLRPRQGANVAVC